MVGRRWSNMVGLTPLISTISHMIEYMNWPEWLQADMGDLGSICGTMSHPRTICDTLWHPVTPCNTLWHPATPCNTLWHPATSCDKLWQAVTPCTTSWPTDSWLTDPLEAPVSVSNTQTFLKVSHMLTLFWLIGETCKEAEEEEKTRIYNKKCEVWRKQNKQFNSNCVELWACAAHWGITSMKCVAKYIGCNVLKGSTFRKTFSNMIIFLERNIKMAPAVLVFLPVRPL